MLIEEIADLLVTIGNLKAYKDDLEDNSNDSRVAYALSWYTFNLIQLQDNLIQAALILGGEDSRSETEFKVLVQPGVSPLDQITLHDLKAKHDDFIVRYLSARKAYLSYTGKFRPITTVLKVTDLNLKLMNWNLKQAFDCYDK